MFNSIYFLLILAMLFWGGNFALGKAISGSIPPLTLAYLRWVIALLVLTPFSLQEIKENKTKLLHNWKLFLLYGVTGLMGFNMCVYSALKFTTAINSGIINSFCPIFVTILAVFFLKEKVSTRQILGIIISFAGVTWIIAKGQLSILLSLSFNNGDILMLSAVVFWGIYTVLLRVNKNLVPQKVLIVFSSIWGLFFTFPLIVFENIYLGTTWTNTLTPFHYWAILYFGVFPALSLLIYNKAVAEIGPRSASVFQNLVVVFAAVFGVAFLHEKLTFAHLVGSILIITGVYLTTQKTITCSTNTRKV